MSLAPWLRRWDLTPDGAAFATRSSRLQPVLWRGQPAMLKLALDPEEAAGGPLMDWWQGDGSAPVLALEPPALLLARAMGDRSLAALAQQDDDSASRILCDVAARLHASRTAPPPPLVDLADWFRPLTDRPWDEPLLARAAGTARALLADPREVRPLHGDLHHDNVKDFGPLGWRAIDPKSLLGERCFDFANLLRNPLGELPLRPRRLARQASIIAESAGLERRRLLGWTLALCGLSMAWSCDSAGRAPDLDVERALDPAVGALALAELDAGQAAAAQPG